MNYVVSVNEAKRTIEVVIDGKYKGVAKCCKSDNYNLQTGLELALERAKVAKKNAEEKANKGNCPTLSGYAKIKALVSELEKALPKGQCIVVGNGVKPTKEMKQWLHSLTDCKGMSADELKAIADNAYDEGYAEGYDEGYSDAYDEIDAVEDDDCDCDEDCDCDCDCHKIVARQGVVVMSGEGAISGAMIRKLIEQYENSLK